MGLRALDVGFGVKGFGFWVWGLGLWMWGLGLGVRALDLGFRVLDSCKSAISAPRPIQALRFKHYSNC